MKYNHHVFAAFCVSAALFLSACEMAVPVKEMAQAKEAITLAAQYKAEKYAKEEFDAAQKALYDAHEFLKKEKESDAKDSAKESKKKADAALDKALPLLALDTISEAKAALSQAEALYAPELAKEKYDAADALVKDTQSKYEAKSFIPSYKTAMEAKIASDAAKEAVLAQLPVLRGRLAEIRDGAAEVRANKGELYAAEILVSLDAKIAEADAAIDQGTVKAASAAVTAAGELLADAKKNVRRGSILSKIKAGEDSFAKILSSPFSAGFPAEMAAIPAVLNDAKRLTETAAFNDAELKADEALKLIDALNIEMAKKIEEDRIMQAALAEKLKKETPPKQETPEPVKEVKPVVKSEEREYVVIYNPKSADCLWKIADKMYKNARLWPLIYMANRSMIKDPDLIYPGQKFIIPTIPQKSAEEVKPADTAPAEKTKDSSVQSGTDAAKAPTEVPAAQ